MTGDDMEELTSVELYFVEVNNEKNQVGFVLYLRHWK